MDNENILFIAHPIETKIVVDWLAGEAIIEHKVEYIFPPDNEKTIKCYHEKHAIV